MRCSLNRPIYWLVMTVCALGCLAPSARAVNLVQEFYLPMPEAQIYQAYSAIVSGTGSTIASTFSIVVTGNGTVIYYDQWEDGYEIDLANPTQSTTQIWGDGNDANGIPPGFIHDPVGLPAGTVITLTNNVTLPRNPSTILWDARDRIAATKALAISRAAWPVNPGPVFAGAVSVLSTLDYGTNYISPVGQDLTNNLFKYVGMFVMAAQNNTAVTIDPNGNGVGVTNIVLNQGESYLVNSGIKKGGRVTSSKPVQADLIIGHVEAHWAADWFTLYPVEEWDNTYYTPVGSASKVPQPAYVYLYNPNPTNITINYHTLTGAGAFSVPASNGVYQFQMPVSSGASFISSGGAHFYALCTVAANNSVDMPWNWGFTLLPKGGLTTEADVGWGPGSADGTVDGSPVWVTTLANTRIYVDYKGDHSGPLTDPNGNHYDTNFDVVTLQSQKIYDPSKNQTGMRVYTVDGTLLTAAWGEDADVAAPGDPYIDAGTMVIPFPVPVLQKTSTISTNVGPPGLSIGDTLQYTVEIDNKSLLPLGNTVVIDSSSTNLLYVTNSTTLNGVAVPDDGSGTAFPLDAPGYTIPIILHGGTSTFQYLETVVGTGNISNSATLPDFKIVVQNVLLVGSNSCNLNFTDSGGTPVALYPANGSIYIQLADAGANTSANTVQTVSAVVQNLTHGDIETVTLTETGTNTGVFFNAGGLSSSISAGLSQQDGILNAAPGDLISVSYNNPVYGNSCSANAVIQIPSFTKQLYLSVNGSTNGVQDLNRIDPVAAAHGPTRTSVDLGVGGNGTIGVAATTTNFTANDTSLTFSHTSGSGPNRLLLVAVGIGAIQAVDTPPGGSVTNVTYGGTAMTQVTSVTNSPSISYIYSLVNPPAGPANVVVSVSSAASIAAGATTFTNVNQAAPFGNSATNSATTGTTATVTISSASGELVFSIADWDVGAVAQTVAASAGQTTVWATNGNYTGAAASTKPGATSVTNTYTAPDSQQWTIAAVSIKPAAVGGPATNVTTFAQTPAFCSEFTMPSNNLITITNYITVTNGVMPASPAVSATLQYNGTNIITLSNPTYSAANSNLVWSGVLTSNITIPAGQVISYVISNGQSDVSFHVDYDSTNKPSKILLPTTSVIHISSLGVYDAPYPGGNLVTTPIAGSTLYVRAAVSDPFGSYDITSLGLAITAPSPNANVNVTLNDTSVVANDGCTKTYEYQWQTGPPTGDYNITAVANEGTEGITDTAATSVSLIFLDLGTPSTTEFTSGNNGPATNAYAANATVCMRVTDLNRNTNSTTVETITATVTSSSGDSELVTFTETSTNTGVFTACLATSTTAGSGTNNGTLNAPVGSILTVSYSDPTDPNDNTSATATILPSPGTPGVVMNKTIVSPSGGQVGVGRSATFNLQVVNTGSTTLTNVSVTDNFPSAKLSYTSASPTPSTVAAGVLTWTNLGNMTPGQSTNFTVTFNTIAIGNATNSATANGGVVTNSSGASVLITYAALNVTKVLLSPTNTPVPIGSNVTFRITIQNTGDASIPTLPLEDTFSGAYFQFVSATIPPNGSGSGSLIWTNLAASTPLLTNATITIDVTMKVVGAGNPANNTATVDFAVDIYGNPVPTASGSVDVVTAAAGISGHVYNDINHSGVFTNGDTGLSGVTLQLSTDPDGDGNPSDGTLVQIVTSDANGYYEFLNLNLGHYVVVEIDLPGFASSAPVNNRIAVNLTTLSTNANNNFFDYQPNPALYSTISGTVWIDTNGNGTNDVGEVGLANVPVDLVQDVNSNGLVDIGEPVTASVTTDTNGNYSFADVTPGDYVIHETDLYGYYSTGDSQGRTDNQISFVSTNGVVSTNNSFFDRLSPTAVNDTSSALYFMPATIYPLTNDISPYGDPLTITNAVTTNGIVVINPGNTNLTFTPTNAGVATIIYTINDAHGGTSTAIITVNVTELADVGIGKSGPALVFAASNLSYAISVTNSGPSGASGVVVTD
ncbi:MAG: SdrD B-like domain-containing protein, partial [Verrucomicrobiota bacterium]